MAHEWQDPEFAQAWDGRALTGNPAREAHLSLLLAILEPADPGWIVDLGCGSGLVAQMVLDRFSNVKVFGLDSSTAMLDIAKHRLSRFGERVVLADGDLTSLDRVEAPGECTAAIAVQSLHHLEESHYRSVVAWTFDHVVPGGSFFIIDRVAIPSGDLYSTFRAARVHNGQTPNQPDWPTYVEWLGATGDRPQPMRVILAMLEQAGFAATALDVRADRALLIGRRPA